MRSVIYAIAILAAAGIMYVIATDSENSNTDNVAPETVASAEKTSQFPGNEFPVSKVTLHVPEMMCPHACYPSIKTHLEKSDSIVSVELTPQKDEDTIDDPKIIVTHRQGFDPEVAVAALETIGFADSSVVQ